MLYFAYGSNLNIQQMKHRCPKAAPLGNFYLRDFRLVFRGVADIIYWPGGVCPGGLWSITKDCEEALDRYEGYKIEAPNNGLYRKSIVEVFNTDGELSMEVMTYQMNSAGIFPPSQLYLDSIIQGYRDFRLPRKRLRAAVKRSYDQKKPTKHLMRRYERKGFPRLAAIV